MSVPTDWLDAWRDCRARIKELADAETPHELEVAHRRADMALDTAMILAFNRGMDAARRRSRMGDSDAG